MKRVLLIIIAVLLISGCGKKEDNTESVMKDNAIKYYNIYMKNVPDQDIASVSIEMMEKANKRSEDFDLSELSKCEKSSYVDLYVNKGTKEIEKYEFSMKCK